MKKLNIAILVSALILAFSIGFWTGRLTSQDSPRANLETPQTQTTETATA